ncbi:hypothetical protein TNCV_4808081 [Trichonephila clavipes]|nr:hypothetical protein TNCV_4808081 [Trichonephila clavipes]
MQVQQSTMELRGFTRVIILEVSDFLNNSIGCDFEDVTQLTDQLDDVTHVPFPLSKKRPPNNPSIEAWTPDSDPSSPFYETAAADLVIHPHLTQTKKKCSSCTGASNNDSPLLKECFEGVLIRVPLRTSYASDLPYASFLMDIIFQCLCLQLSCKSFPGISDTKLTEAMFVAPDIRKHMKDNELETCLTAKEIEAMVIFKDKTFLGNCKDIDCKRIAMNKLEKF